MSHVYVEQNYAQNLIVGEKTILNSVTNTDSVKTSISKQQGSVLKTVNIWMQRSRQRKQLSQLDSHLLKDIGLTEEMAAKEIAKPFWK